MTNNRDAKTRNVNHQAQEGDGTK